MLYTLIFTICITRCSDNVLGENYASRAACDAAGKIVLARSEEDIAKAKSSNVTVKFKCSETVTSSRS